MSFIIQRNVSNVPEVAVGGSGIRLRLANGQHVIDGSGGPAVACIGHGNERVADAIGRQARQMAYVHSTFYTSEPAERLADLLLSHRPGGLTHAFFVSSGSEAVEAAIKLARQYFVECGQPRRTRFIARRQSFHGVTLGALSLGGHVGRRAHFEPLLAGNISRVSPCFPYRYQNNETDSEYVDRLAAELEQEIQRVGPETVAAFFAETIVGATAGCVTATPGYFREIRKVCDRHGILLVLDEVMCGMGRSGTLHAWEQEDVAPDIQVIGKGLGGGYQPIGAVLASDKVVEALRSGSAEFVHGQTYQAHPVACAGALEVQRIIAEEDLVSNAARMGEKLDSMLKERFGAHDNVGDIRGRGLFRALEFVSDRETRAPCEASKKVAYHVRRAALDCGLIIYPSGGTVDGSVGDHVIVAPPFNVIEDELDEIVTRLGKAIDLVL